MSIHKDNDIALKMPSPQVSENPIEHHFKKFTHYHIYFFILYLITRIPLVWHLINFLFLSPPLSFTCDGKKDSCPCANPVWDKSVFSKTIQMKYGIYCDKHWMISMSETVCVFGLLVGSMAFGSLSDRFGRLLVFAISSFTVGTCSCLVTLMPSMLTYVFMRFLEGVGLAGVIVSSYVLAIEYCGVGYRETVSAILHFPINVGHMSIAGVSYLLRDCDQFQIAISLPMFIPCFFWFILMESPKWLLDNNQRERTIKTLEKICRFNKGANCESIRAEIEAYCPATAGERLKFYQLWKYKVIVKNLICIGYLSFTCGLGYYGVTEFIGKLSGDMHLNTFIGGSFLVPGTFLSVVLLNKLSRKAFIMFACITSGVCMIIVTAIPTSFKPHWVRTLCAGLANSTFYMLYIVTFLYCMELFPTSARNSALGYVSVVSRVGQMLGPQINRLSLTISGSIFGVLALLSTVAVLPMPETKGIELPSGTEGFGPSPPVTSPSTSPSPAKPTG